MTTTKKKRRKKSVKKLKYSNKNLNFIHVATLGRYHFDPAGDHPGSQRLWGNQSQNPGRAYGRLYQGSGSR